MYSGGGNAEANKPRIASWWNVATQTLSNQFPPPKSRELVPLHFDKKQLGHQSNRYWIPKGHKPNGTFVFPNQPITVHPKQVVAQRTWKLRIRPSNAQKKMLRGLFQNKRNEIDQIVQTLQGKSAREIGDSFCDSKSPDVQEWFHHLQSYCKSSQRSSASITVRGTSNFKQHVLLNERVVAEGKLSLQDAPLLPWHTKDWNRFVQRFPTFSTKKPVRIVFVKPCRWYCMLPFDLALLEKSAVKTSAVGLFKKIIAMDPGSKTFQAAYDSEGKFMEFGKAFGNRLYRIGGRPSNTQKSLYSKKRDRLSRQSDLCDDMQKKLASKLTRDYTDIFLPKLDVQKMYANLLRTALCM